MSDYSGHFNWLREWYNTPAGQRLLALESRYLRRELSRHFCPYIVQIGALGWEQQFLQPDWPGEYAVITHQLMGDFSHAQVVSRFDAIPIESDSVDMVILPHTLELCSHPMPVIEEAERILRPEGRLITAGFTPWSLYTLYGLMPLAGYARQPQSLVLISPRTIRHWLHLLSFATASSEGLYHGARQITGDMLAGRYHPLVSASYMIRATKRRYNPISLRPEWITANNFKQPGLIDVPLRKIADDR